ncbi:MAG TPA: DUF6452 family protein [Flavobacterium sp.]|nr:DUF6452 family protein [Flavobacterium sp.]
MEKLQRIIIVIAFALCFSGCEKDDICAESTPTTPRLVIGFYSYENPALMKSVTNLTAVGNSQATGVVFNETASDASRYYRTGTSAALPLDISQGVTTYRLRINSESPNPAVFNEDIITINYAAQQVYVSRACGYKTIFELSSITEQGPAADQWIKNLTIEKTKVDNENEKHVKIYF